MPVELHSSALLLPPWPLHLGKLKPLGSCSTVGSGFGVLAFGVLGGHLADGSVLGFVGIMWGWSRHYAHACNRLWTWGSVPIVASHIEW